jgi:lipase
VRLHVHEWGDVAAPPLVCLHGVSGHGRRFRKLVEERLAARFHVLAPDLRGHGRSAWDPPWNLGQHLEDVLETLELLGVRPASWLGHSFGGRLILEVGDVAPELVERAVLLDPAIRIQPERALELAESERAEKAFSSVDEAIEKRIETAPLYRTPRVLLEEEMREHLTESRDGRLRYRYCQSAVVAMYGELAGADAFDFARVPTLLVVGADSGLVTESQVTTLRDALAEELTVVTVPGGHIVLWDAFDETADAIDAFL